MRSLKIFSLIGLAMLLMSAVVSAEVYDDEGEVITEEEIEAEMGSAQGRAGCLFFGGLFSLGASFLGSCVLGAVIGGSTNHDEIVVPVLVIGTIAGTILGGKLSYEVGESIDRRAAIKKIKEKRRKQKQGLLNLDNGQFFLVQPELQQLKVNQFHHRQSENNVVIPLITVGF